MAVILANGIVTATMHFKHDERPREVFYEKYYYIEIAFTILLNCETIFKIWCLGWRGYWKHSIHKFELLLSIGTTIHVIPGFYMTGFTYFQVEQKIFTVTVNNVIFNVGSESGAANQGLSSSGGFRLQNLRSRQKIRQSYHFHHVFADHIFEHFNAAVLLPLRFHKVWEFCRGVHVHVPDLNPGSLGGSNGRNDAADETNARSFGCCVFYFVPSFRHIGKVVSTGKWRDLSE